MSKIPLIVAISGHRDILQDDLPEAGRRLRDALAKLKNAYPNTPIRLLSGLAEGADRMAAHAAREQGIELVAVLPMPREEFEKDFATADSRQEFADLLKSAAQRCALPLVAGNTPANISTPEKRNLQYEQLGAFLVRHSHIVISVWDGRDPGKVGGTAAVVGFRRRGLPEQYALERGMLGAVDTRPVFHIPVRRKTDSPAQAYSDFWRQMYKDDAPAAAAYHLLLPQDSESGDYAANLDKLDRFNRDAGQCPEAALKASKDRLFPLPLPEDPQEAVLLDAYSAADALALRFQKKHWRAAAAIYACAAAMAVSYGLYGTVLPASWLLPFYLALFGLMALVYLVQRKRQYQERFLDSRALAEGLRVQFFWRLAGLPHYAASSYLRKQSEAIQWIRDALEAVAFGPVDQLMSSDQQQTAQARIAEYWIRNQLAYFKEASVRDRNRVFNIEQGARLFYGCGLLAAVMAASLATFAQVTEYRREAVVLLMGLPPALAVLWQSYADHMSYKDHAMEYARMEALYALANRKLTESVKNFGDFERLVSELGKEALRENGDWLITHRRRPVKIQ